MLILGLPRRDGGNGVEWSFFVILRPGVEEKERQGWQDVARVVVVVLLLLELPLDVGVPGNIEYRCGQSLQAT